MVISAFSPASIWNATTRTLTGFSANLLIPGGTINQVLAGSATVDFRPALNRCVFNTIGVITPAAGGATINSTDGTNVITFATIGAATSSVSTGLVGSQNASGSVGFRITNTTVNAGTYFAAGITLVQ